MVRKPTQRKSTRRRSTGTKRYVVYVKYQMKSYPIARTEADALAKKMRKKGATARIVPVKG